jgi:hypothetical protein
MVMATKADLVKQIEDLRRKLPANITDAPDEMEGEAVEPTSISESQGGVWLELRNERFECRRVSTTWQMMKFAKARRDAQITIPKNLDKNSARYKELTEKRSAAGMLMLDTMRETVMVLLKEYERDRFEDYMEKISLDGLNPSELENAIGDAIARAGGESGKAEVTTSQRSSSSSTIDGESIPAS